MLLPRVIQNSLLKFKSSNFVPVANCTTGGWHDERRPIGKREWVGYGITSQPNYVDRVDFPMPAVRFREITGDLVALKEKEKGDWKNLTLEEKKKLYRASFRQTLSEVQAPTGEWKSIAGSTLLLVSVAIVIFTIQKTLVLPPLPETFSEERRAHQLRKMLVNRDGHLSGVSANWDYEKDDWK